MTGKAHFRVRGVTCGKCSRVHSWYKYRVWREGKKLKEEYIGRCDEFGNIHVRRARSRDHRKTQSGQANRQTHPNARQPRSPYEVLGVTYYATRAEINLAYRRLVKRYHPDLNKTIDPRLIIEINVAYQTLIK